MTPTGLITVVVGRIPASEERLALYELLDVHDERGVRARYDSEVDWRGGMHLALSEVGWAREHLLEVGLPEALWDELPRELEGCRKFLVRGRMVSDTRGNPLDGEWSDSHFEVSDWRALPGNHPEDKYRVPTWEVEEMLETPRSEVEG